MKMYTNCFFPSLRLGDVIYQNLNVRFLRFLENDKTDLRHFFRI